MSEEESTKKPVSKTRAVIDFIKELYNGYFDEFESIHSLWGKLGWAFSPIWLPTAIIAVIGGYFTYQVIIKRRFFRKGTLVEHTENPSDYFIVMKLIADIDDREGFMCNAYSIDRMAEFRVPLNKLKKAKV